MPGKLEARSLTLLFDLDPLLNSGHFPFFMGNSIYVRRKLIVGPNGTCCYVIRTLLYLITEHFGDDFVCQAMKFANASKTI